MGSSWEYIFPHHMNSESLPGLTPAYRELVNWKVKRWHIQVVILRVQHAFKSGEFH